MFDAEIFAFRHRERDGVEESLRPFYVRGGDPAHTTRQMPSRTRVTRSDERGAFAFSGLSAGHYDVVARDSSLVLGYLRRVEIAPVGVQDTVVVMPPHGQFFCDLRGLGVVPPSSRLELVLVPDTLKWTGGLHGGRLYPVAREVADVTGDGLLSFSNVLNGPAELFLRIPPVMFKYEPMFPSSGCSESLVSLIRVNVPNTPDSAVLLDVEQLGIGWIQVEYDCDLHGSVVATAVKVGGDFLTVGGTYARPGPVVIGPLLAGYWQVGLEATDKSWKYDHPVAIQLEPGRQDAVIQISAR